MAGCQPCSRSEDQSPQPSSSGYPLQAVMGEESPGPSAPRVDPHPPPPSCGWKRRREESEEETAPGGEDVWVVETLCGLKMKLKRQRLSSVLPEHHEVFNRLLAVRDNDRAPLFTEDPNPSSLLTTPQGYHHIFLAKDPVVKRFLAWDKNLRVSDKYLLSMVIAYFSRAGLFSWQFQRIHFFVALYLANDMEEDNQAPKQAIFSFLYGKNRSQRPLFHKLRFQFIRSMGWKTRVSREECEEIQAFDPELWVWGRDRTLMP